MLGRAVVQFLGLLLVVGLLAPPAAADGVVLLAGTNVVTGSTTSRITVRVERDAVLDLTPSTTDAGETAPAGLQVEGEGEFVGFALTERISTYGFFAVAVRTPELGADGRRSFVGYGQPAAEHRDEQTPLSDDVATCLRCVVPAGEYHLYLITGSRDATVTFTLEDLGGEAELGADGRALRTNEGMAEGERWFSGEGGVVNGGGMGTWFWTSHDSPEPGLLLHAYRTVATPSGALPVVAAVEHCEGVSGETTCRREVDRDGGHDETGFAVAGGTMTDATVSASVDLTVAGADTFSVGQAVLWLPLDDYWRTVDVGADDDARFDVFTW